MADTTNLEVVTPSAIILSEPVEMVVVPGQTVKLVSFQDI